jgi:lipoprotein-anchoring transpeptidase ErfK/SrfK
VHGRQRIGLVWAGVLAIALAVLPAAAAGQNGLGSSTAGGAAGDSSARSATIAPEKAAPAKAHLSVQAKGVRNRKLRVGHRGRAVGYLRPFVPGQRVEVALVHQGHVVTKRNPVVTRVHGTDKGRFQLKSKTLIKPGTYRIVARHAATPVQGRAVARSPKFHLKYPNLGRGAKNSSVKLFNHLLLRQGYYTTHGKRYGSKTGFAVMAFRKVNGMKRTYNASPGIFRKLAAGKGSFHLHYPGKGKHVEVDISKQVMVLANHGKPQYTFHVSTGAPATPTIRGHYHFYMRQPGFNSEGMYYSVYWHGGYAIHGYHSVPPYPASHGCVRNPIPESKFIYNWVSLGMSIYTYG